MISLSRAALSFRCILLASATTALLLLSAPLAHAGLTISSPAAGSTITMGAAQELRIQYMATCPPGKFCGTINDQGAFGQGFVTLELEHATLGPTSDDRFKDGLWWAGSASGSTTETTMTRRFDAHAGGRWHLRSTWVECEDARNVSTCSVRQPIDHAFNVRAATFDPQHSFNGVRGKASQVSVMLNFQRNMPRAQYRGRFVLQKQVKIGKKRRWVTVTSRPNVRFQQSQFNAEKSWAHAAPKFTITKKMAKSISNSTRMRARITVTTTKAPKLQRTFTTKIRTRGQLRQDSGSGGGGVVIGS